MGHGRVSGIVVNTVSLGHITGTDSPQNGQGTPFCSSFAPTRIPQTLKVFRHFVQVRIFSIMVSMRRVGPLSSAIRPTRLYLGVTFTGICQASSSHSGIYTRFRLSSHQLFSSTEAKNCAWMSPIRLTCISNSVDRTPACIGG